MLINLFMLTFSRSSRSEKSYVSLFLSNAS